MAFCSNVDRASRTLIAVSLWIDNDIEHVLRPRMACTDAGRDLDWMSG